MPSKPAAVRCGVSNMRSNSIGAARISPGKMCQHPMLGINASDCPNFNNNNHNEFGPFANPVRNSERLSLSRIA